MDTTRRGHLYERWCRRTDGPLLLLAVAFVVVLLLPLYDPELPDHVRAALYVANVVLWLAFGLDYLTRLSLAPDRVSFARTHVPDLLMVAVPFLRPLRLLRVIGLLGAASRRAGERQLVQTTAYVIGGVLVLVVVAGGLVLDAERGDANANIVTAQDALWWASTTVTTVGYGDRFPVTGQGRLIAVALMVGGIALLGVVTASVATWFVRRFSALESMAESSAAETRATVALAEVSEKLARIEAALERQAALYRPN